jgi:hypothetical protein
MNDIPTECLFCGTPCSAELKGMLMFRCGSVWFLESQRWLQFSRCELAVLRARIGRAIESLKAAERFDLRPMGNFLGDGMVRNDKYGEWTEAEILDKVLGILQGDSNE